VWLSALHCPFVQVAALGKGSFPLGVASVGKSQATLSFSAGDPKLSSNHSDQCGFSCALHHYDRCSPLTTCIYLWGVKGLGLVAWWFVHQLGLEVGGKVSMQPRWSRSQDIDTLYRVTHSTNSAHSA